uniref:Putative secreted protein n=1 Tax=Ixodes ricinus TaxID=34613 RepID=A0A0K8RHL8_IXORI
MLSHDPVLRRCLDVTFLPLTAMRIWYLLRSQPVALAELLHAARAPPPLPCPPGTLPLRHGTGAGHQRPGSHPGPLPGHPAEPGHKGVPLPAGTLLLRRPLPVGVASEISGPLLMHPSGRLRPRTPRSECELAARAGTRTMCPNRLQQCATPSTPP